MQAWNSFRYIYGAAIFVGFGFKRPWEGGYSNLSQRYAGLAFDIGQNLTNSQRNAMRNLAISSGIWNYLEPKVQVFKKNYIIEEKLSTTLHILL